LAAEPLFPRIAAEKAQYLGKEFSFGKKTITAYNSFD
jgi:hypothetical protein